MSFHENDNPCGYDKLLDVFTNNVTDANYVDFSKFVYAAQQEKIDDLVCRVQELEAQILKFKEKVNGTTN